jgi:hypothetical protein
MTLNSRSAEFCRKCGYPIGKVATLDPVQSIQTQGLLFRKATEGRPKRIVLIGIWLCFLPGLVAGVYAAFRLILNPKGFSDFFFFWAAVGLCYIAFIILYRTTKNYITIPEKTGRDKHKEHVRQ